ncbi:muscle M-line assembly protein unc-89-like [Limulus polyphemus]|uniref:Muscle M-line assembly protein unc-89-like n=1 Tax=Limulus polyphemus TaxID=6850 RepID=A0ABM1B7G9_LIMPO|nr:muscle M-line assembly protein unc-89-like [Limulus polyphemus]
MTIFDPSRYNQTALRPETASRAATSKILSKSPFCCSSHNLHITEAALSPKITEKLANTVSLENSSSIALHEMAVSGANDTNKNHQSPNTEKSEEHLSVMIEPPETEKDTETTETAAKTDGEERCVNRHVDVQDVSSNAPASSREAPHRRFYRSLSARLPKSVSKRNEEPESSDEACCTRLAYVFQRKALDLASRRSEKKNPPIKPPKPTPEAIAKASASREAHENEVRFREKRTRGPRPRSFGDDIPVCKGVIRFIDDSGSEVSSDYPNVDLYQFITVRKHDSSEADYSDNGLYEIPDVPNSQKEVPASGKTILQQERENEAQMSESSALQHSSIFPKLSFGTNFKDKFFKPMLGKTSSRSPSKSSQGNSDALKILCETKHDQGENTSRLKEETVNTEPFLEEDMNFSGSVSETKKRIKTSNTSSKVFPEPVENTTKTSPEIKTLKQLAQEKSEVTETQFSSAATKENLPEAAANDFGIPVRPVPPARSKSQREKHVAKSPVHKKSFIEQNGSEVFSEEKAIASTDITYTQNVQEQSNKPQEEVTTEKYSLSEEEKRLAKTVQDVNFVDRLREDEEEGCAENVKEMAVCDKLTEERKSAESCREFSDVDLTEEGISTDNMKESICFDKIAQPICLDKQMEEKRSSEESKSAQQGELVQETYYAVPKPAVPPRPKRLGVSSQRSLQAFSNEIKTKTHPPRSVSPNKKASSINKQGRSVSLAHKTPRPNSPLSKTQRPVSPSSNTKRSTTPINKVRPTSPSQKLGKPVSITPKAKNPSSPVSKQQNERPNTPTAKGPKPTRPPRPFSPQAVPDTFTTPQTDATTPSDKLEATDHLPEATNFTEDVKVDNNGLIQKSGETSLMV